MVKVEKFCYATGREIFTCSSYSFPTEGNILYVVVFMCCALCTTPLVVSAEAEVEVIFFCSHRSLAAVAKADTQKKNRPFVCNFCSDIIL